jgi:hypothetical protein
MSTRNRKLGYYSLDYLSGESHSFDSDLFCGFIRFLNGLPEDERLFNDAKNNKAVALSSIRDEVKQGMQFFKLTFKSCKYNHSPDYMSSVDGSERPTDKQLHEGDRELTHMCMRIDANEAYTVFEERKNGVTMGGVISYFNRLLNRYFSQAGVSNDRILWASLVPPDDFLTALREADRISIADIFVEKKVLGSGYLDIMAVDASSQDDLVMTLKAKRSQSLPKRAIRTAFQAIATEGTEVTRIRLHGKDINKMNIVIDSLNQKKVEEVTVDLREDGTVDSYSIFAKIEEVLGVTE